MDRTPLPTGLEFAKVQVDYSYSPYLSLSLFSFGSLFLFSSPQNKRNKTGALTHEDQKERLGPKNFPKMVLAEQTRRRISEQANPVGGGNGMRRVTEKNNSMVAFPVEGKVKKQE